MEIKNDKTVQTWEPEEVSGTTYQFNILFEDGSTAAGFDEEYIAIRMLKELRDERAAVIEHAEGNTPPASIYGDLDKAQLIKREIVTKYICLRGEWEPA